MILNEFEWSPWYYSEPLSNLLSRKKKFGSMILPALRKTTQKGWDLWEEELKSTGVWIEAYGWIVAYKKVLRSSGSIWFLRGKNIQPLASHLP